MGTMCSACSAKDLEENDLKVTDFSEKERPDKGSKTKKKKKGADSVDTEEAVDDVVAGEGAREGGDDEDEEEKYADNKDDKVKPATNSLAEMDTVLKAVEAGQAVPESEEASEKPLQADAAHGGSRKAAEATPCTPLEKELSALNGLNTPCAPAVLFNPARSGSHDEAEAGDCAEADSDGGDWTGFQQAPSKQAAASTPALLQSGAHEAFCNPFEEVQKPAFWEDNGGLGHRMASIENWLSTFPTEQPPVQTTKAAGNADSLATPSMTILECEPWVPVFPDPPAACTRHCEGAGQIDIASVRPWQHLPSVGTWILQLPHAFPEHAASTTPRRCAAAVNLLEFDASPSGNAVQVKDVQLSELPFIGSPAFTPHSPSTSTNEAPPIRNVDTSAACDAESSEEDNYSFEDSSSSSASPSSNSCSSRCARGSLESATPPAQVCSKQAIPTAEAWLAELAGLDFKPSDFQLQAGVPFIGSLPPTPTGDTSPALLTFCEAPVAAANAEALRSGPTLLGSQPGSPQKVMAQWPLSPRVVSPAKTTFAEASKVNDAAIMSASLAPCQTLSWHMRPSVGSWLLLPAKMPVSIAADSKPTHPVQAVPPRSATHCLGAVNFTPTVAAAHASSKSGLVLASVAKQAKCLE